MTFELPAPSELTVPEYSLTYMPILDMAALIKAKVVSCVDVVDHFTARLRRSY